MGSIRDTVVAAARSLREILGNRDIRQLQFAWTSGTAADWALLVAVLVVAYQAGGPLAVGVLGLVRMVPATLVALFVVVPPRHREERVLAWINVIRAASAAVLAGTLVTDGPLAIVFIAAAAAAAAGSLVRPMQTALLPSLARSPEELVASNVASSTGESLGMFLGPFVGGLVLAVAGPAAVSLIVAVAFGCAAIAVAVITIPPAAAARREAASGDPPRPAGVPIVEGVQALLRRPAAGLVVLGFGAQTLVRGLLTTLVVVASIELLDLGEAGVGAMNGLIGAGGFAGAIFAITLVVRTRLAPAFALALVGWGVPLAAIGVLPLAVVALAAMVVVGISNAILDVAGFTLLQRSIPNEQRLAVFRVFEGLVGAGVSVGAVLAPLLIALLDVRGALLVSGLILPLVAALTWPRLARIDREAVVPARELRALRSVALFAPLPLTALERLAAVLVPRRLAAGEVLMREGDPGDRFYIVESGALEVSRGTDVLRRCGAGDGLGEIALLRRVPRTATVTATEPAIVFGLDRPEFLAAVTGHPGSLAAADEVIGERLERSGRGAAG